MSSILKAESETPLSIDILYVDKNNTPEIWGANSQMIKDIANEE